MSKWTRALFYTLACCIIFYAVLLNIARALTPLLTREKVFFEKLVGDLLHQPVKIQSLSASWQGFYPQLKLDHVLLGNTVSIRQLSISFNLGESLWHRSLLPKQLLIDGANLSFSLEKWPVNTTDNTEDSRQIKAILFWILTQTDLVLQHVNVHLTVAGQTYRLNGWYARSLQTAEGHQVAGSVHFVEGSVVPIRFMINISHGKLNTYSAVEQFNLQALPQVLLPNLQGEFSGPIWTTWQQGVLQKVQAVPVIKHLQLSKMTIAQLQGDFVWQANSKGFEVFANPLLMTTSLHTRAKLALLVDSSTKNPRYLLKVEEIHLSNLVKLLEYFHEFPAAWQALYKGLQPEVFLHKLLVSEDKQTQPQFAIRADFDHLSCQHFKQFPALQQGQGTFYASNTQAQLLVNSRALFLFAPNLFVKPFLFNIARGFFAWDQQSQTLTLRNVFLSDGNLQLLSDGAITQPTRAPFVDLVMHLTLHDLTQIQRYLPLKGMKPHLYAWLSQAFLAGGLSDAHLIWRGALQDFPYQKSEGQFEALAQLNQVTLRYHPKWPSVEHMLGSVFFHQQRMNIHIQSAKTEGISIHRIDAVMNHLATSTLEVTAVLQGDLQAAKTYIGKSPLSLAKDFALMELSGKMQLNLHLSVGLHAENTPVNTQGLLTLQAAKLALPSWKVALSNIQGIFQFTNHVLIAHQVRANFLNQPVTIEVGQTVDQAQQSALKIQVLGHYLLKKSLPHLAGGFFYQLNLLIHDVASAQSNQLKLSSNLQGLSITQVPAPFVKTKAQIKPFSVLVDIRKNTPIFLNALYADQIKLALEVLHNTNSAQILRGNLHFGQGDAHLQREPGVRIDGGLSNVEISQWKDFLTPFFNKKSKTSASSLLTFSVIDLWIDHLMNHSQDFLKTHLQVFSKPSSWLVKLQNTQLAGQAEIPKNTQARWQIDLNYLNLPRFSGKGLNTQWNIRKLPPISLKIQQFRPAGNDWGFVALETHPNLRGLVIDQLLVNNANYRLALSGYFWQSLGAQTFLQGKIRVENAGLMLASFGYPNLLEDGLGDITLHVGWQGSPMDFTATSLQGDVQLSLNNGRILKVGGASSELSFGRLINVLSIESLPSNLLDLKDLNKKGFQYSHLESNIVFTQGRAKFSQSNINGPIAKIFIAGLVDLAQKRYDFNFSVRPYVTASLPVIVGIAGGPIAGAVAWLVNKMVEPSIGKALGSTYHVGGTFLNPNIQKIK